jgi:hypothetical protein
VDLQVQKRTRASLNKKNTRYSFCLTDLKKKNNEKNSEINYYSGLHEILHIYNAQMNQRLRKCQLQFMIESCVLWHVFWIFFLFPVYNEKVDNFYLQTIMYYIFHLECHVFRILQPKII